MNKSKRKEKVMSSIDSIHITARGDSSEKDINGIFNLFTTQAESDFPHDLPNFVHSTYKPKLHERNNLRDSRFIKLKNGLTIKCSSTAGKGKQLPDTVICKEKGTDIETFALDTGGLVYEVGGISSYKFNHVLDSWSLPKVFEVLRQLWGYNMELTEVHFAFDVLIKTENLFLLPLVPSSKEEGFMSTEYFDIQHPCGIKLRVRFYNKSLKDMTYLDVSRIEIICKKDFFKKIGLDKILMADNDDEIRASSRIVAKEMRSFFENSLSVFLSNGLSLLPKEKEIENQFFQIVKTVRGTKDYENSKYNPLQYFSQEQHNLMEASWKLDKYIRNIEKHSGLTLAEMLIESKLPSTRTGIKIAMPNGKTNTISLSTVKKIRSFLDSHRLRLLADIIHDELSGLIKAQISEVAKLAVQDYESGTPYGLLSGLACIRCKEISPALSRIFRKYLSPSLSSIRDNQDKCEIASILFNKQVTTLSEELFNQESELIFRKMLKKVEFRYKNIIAMKKKGIPVDEVEDSFPQPTNNEEKTNSDSQGEMDPDLQRVSPEGASPEMKEKDEDEAVSHKKDINYFQRKREFNDKLKKEEQEHKKRAFNDALVDKII